MIHYLTIPEELFLLTVNEKTGRTASVKSKKFDILLAASILMDLALHHRIDTDMNYVMLDNPEPTGHPLLDQALEIITNAPVQEKITHWLLKLSEKAVHFRKLLVSGLIEKGLVKMDKERVFLGFSSKKYPSLIHNEEIIEVKTRVRELVFGDDLPEFRDVVIISIAWYGGLLNLIFSEEEIAKCHSRIELLAKMDLIGQAVSKSMKELTLSIIFSIHAKEILGIKSPEEKLEDLVEEMKTLMHIRDENDLPDWLRKGADQYKKTLDFIKETGTNEIVFNPKTGKYGLKIWAGLR